MVDNDDSSSAGNEAASDSSDGASAGARRPAVQGAIDYKVELINYGDGLATLASDNGSGHEVCSTGTGTTCIWLRATQGEQLSRCLL